MYTWNGEKVPQPPPCDSLHRTGRTVMEDGQRGNWRARTISPSTPSKQRHAGSTYPIGVGIHATPTPRQIERGSFGGSPTAVSAFYNSTRANPAHLDDSSICFFYRCCRTVNLPEGSRPSQTSTDDETLHHFDRSELYHTNACMSVSSQQAIPPRPPGHHSTTLRPEV